MTAAQRPPDLKHGEFCSSGEEETKTHRSENTQGLKLVVVIAQMVAQRNSTAPTQTENRKLKPKHRTTAAATVKTLPTSAAKWW